MRDADPCRSRNDRECAYLDIFSAGAASGHSRAAEKRTRYCSRRTRAAARRLSQFKIRRDGLQRIHEVVSAGMGNRAHRDRTVRSVRRHVSQNRDHSDFAMDHPPRSALASRSPTLRSRALDAARPCLASKVFLLPFRRWAATVHRRIICVDGRRAAACGYCQKLEIFYCERYQSGTHAVDHLAAEVRNEIAGRTATRLNTEGTEDAEVCLESPSFALSSRSLVPALHLSPKQFPCVLRVLRVQSF